MCIQVQSCEPVSNTHAWVRVVSGRTVSGYVRLGTSCAWVRVVSGYPAPGAYSVRVRTVSGYV